MFMEQTKVMPQGSAIISGDLDVAGISYLTHLTASSIVSPTIDEKQEKLVSGTNIKTINGNSLLGNGDIVVMVDTNDKISKSGDTMTGALNIKSTLNVGTGNTVSGSYSVIQGYDNIANGNYSHAEGRTTITNASSSHAEGWESETYGYHSHAEGCRNITSGSSSHAEGLECRSNGDYSHAEGNASKTFGICSHAEGKNTITNNPWEHASGMYNSSSSSSLEGETSYFPYSTLFTVGNGTDDNNRQNALEIHYNGDIFFYKNGIRVKLQDLF